MGSIVQLSPEIIMDRVVGRRQELACMRMKGDVNSAGIWAQEIGRQNGLTVYWNLLKCIATSGYITTATYSPAHIASINLLAYRDPASLTYTPINYPVLQDRHGVYSYDSASDLSTFTLILAMLHESGYSLVMD